LTLGRICAGALTQSENAYDDERQQQPNGCRVQGKTGIAQRLIAAHCDGNVRNDAGQTALMMAAMSGRTDIVKMLLMNAANPELQDGAANTALMLAQQQANLQMVTSAHTGRHRPRTH
jgi:hypothetical protein